MLHEYKEKEKEVLQELAGLLHKSPDKRTGN